VIFREQGLLYVGPVLFIDKKTGAYIIIREEVMRLIEIVASILALLTLNYGQLETRMDISSFYDDNILLSPLPVSDMVSDFDFHMNYDGLSGSASLYYNGTFMLYRQRQQYNSSLHDLGFDYYRIWGAHTLYLGGAAAFKMNHTTYNLYNYQQFYLYGSMRFVLNRFLLKTGYNFRYRYYNNYAEIVNSQHYLFGQINKSFWTGTSLLLEMDLGYKTYPNQGSVYALPMGGRGQGRSQNYYQAGLSYSHLIWLARISQSLHPKIGINFRYRQQIGLDQSAFSINSYDYAQNDELFDDPFSYNSDSYSSQLTWHLPVAFKFIASGIYSDKTYHNEQPYLIPLDGSNEGGYRHDYQQRLSIILTKNFYLNKNWIKSFQFGINYYYVNNNSNSYWFRYRNNIYRFNLAWVR
jgi:hypothetical protein